MILTFAKLQRLSGLTKPTAVKAWLRREGVAFLRDREGRPFTTLDALNRKLQRATDDGFRLDDPEGGIPEKRALVSRRPKQVGRADQGGRRAGGVTQGATRYPYQRAPEVSWGAIGGVSAAGGNRASDEAGI